MKDIEEVLIVDGYNVIGDWPELNSLKQLSLESARDRLIDLLAGYQAFSGMRIIVVFDAHHVPGHGGKYRQSRVQVHYTKEKETADECIERFVGELTARRRRIIVATSDVVEQHVTFGKGALRLSARELLLDVETSRKEVRRQITEQSVVKTNTIEGKLSLDAKLMFERWRRGE